MNPWLNYHHLYYFKTIAEEGSIAKAAKRLRLGQPTLSAQLKQLENSIGVKLFEREHKKLKINESGKIALEYASEIFKMGSEMTEVLNDRLIPSRLHVQIGALDSVPKKMILKLVKAALQIAPCSVSILEGHDDELLRELLSHRIDLILTNHVPSSKTEAKLYSRSVAKLPILICGAPKFRELRKGFPNSLNQKPFVLPTFHSKLRHEIDHYFLTHHIQPDILAETQDTSLQKLMGTDGMGLIPIPEFSVKKLISQQDLILIGPMEGVTEELYLVSASRKIENSISSQLFKNFSFT